LLLSHFSKDTYFADKTMAVVLGPMVQPSGVIPATGANRNLVFYDSPPDIADIMAKSAVGISNGGSTLMEFTMLGIPTMIFPQTDKEDAFVETFVKEGCGISGSLELKEFTRQFRELRENEALRRAMSRKAVDLVDGAGAARVADEIVKFLLGGQA
jgi:spore coat polysaccharide biosynthesis predicted glycosyltransferase SpsG